MGTILNLIRTKNNTKYFEETIYDKLSLDYLIPEKVIEYILQERYPEIYKKGNRKNFKNN